MDDTVDLLLSGFRQVEYVSFMLSRLVTKSVHVKA